MGAEIVFVDTPPAAGEEIRLAIQPADLVLIPCRASIDDLEAVGATAGIAQALGKPCHVVLNACTVRSSLTEEAAHEVTTGGGSICPVRVHERTVFKRAAMAGQGAVETEPGGKAAGEINGLWQWLCGQLCIPAIKGADMLAPLRDVVQAPLHH
jgi:chromosome partitioning protein